MLKLWWHHKGKRRDKYYLNSALDGAKKRASNWWIGLLMSKSMSGKYQTRNRTPWCLLDAPASASLLPKRHPYLVFSLFQYGYPLGRSNEKWPARFHLDEIFLSYESRTRKTFLPLPTEHQQPISKLLWQAMEWLVHNTLPEASWK